MSKAKSEPKATPETFALTLDEFCRRRSLTDKRVELIGAFHGRERAAGSVKDTEANYNGRFQQFVRAPVQQ